MRQTNSLTRSTLSASNLNLKGRHQLLIAALVLLVGVGFAAFFYGRTAAATAPTLGTAQSFAVLGGSTVTNTGPSVITGNLGVWPGTSITGFPPGVVVGGVQHANDAVAMQAQSDVTTAYNALASQPCDTDLTGQDLGGLTLTAGVYCFDTSAQLTGTLVLDAEGDPNAVFVFKMGSTLTTASASTVQIINAGQNCNVFWQVGSSATLGTGTTFIGNILALASVTLNTAANLSGRALARTGAVTLDSNAVSAPFCIIPVVPTIGKAFSPVSINPGGVSTLTITLSNPNTNPAILTSPFIDNLPAGVVIAPTPNAANTCGGVVTAVAGLNMITMTGGAVPAGSPGTCTITVDVTAAAAGVYLNTIPAGALQTVNGNNAFPALATLTVVPPTGAPTLAKAFSPATINAGGVSTLTITLINPNAGAATLSAPLIDTLPAGVVIAATPNAANTCGGMVTAVAGGGTVTLTGGAIPGGAPGTCTVTVDVTAALGGSYINTLPAGILQTSNGNNPGAAIATLTVVPPPPVSPTIAKAFTPGSITAGGVSTLTITLSNPNTNPATLTAPLVDTLPAGVVIAATPNASTTCGGTVTAVAGAGAVTLTGGTIPGGAPGTCTLTVSVTAAAGGSYVNTLPAGILQTVNGINVNPAIATLTVVPPVGPPVIGKAFTPASINAGGVSTLTITLSNPNPGAATLTAPLVDTLPAGVVVAPTPNASNTCGGVVTAVAGAGTVTLTGGAIPGGAPGTCNVTVDVTGAMGGSFINNMPAGALQTDNGNNPGAAIATLIIVPLAPPVPPTLSKAFNPLTINVDGTSTLTITLSNPNITAATLTAPLVDTLPVGVVIAPTPNAANTCGGVVTAIAGAGTVTLTGGAIPAGNGVTAGTCTVTVNVTSALPGNYLNTLPANILQTSNGNNIAAAIATLIVTCPLIDVTITAPAAVCELTTGNLASVPATPGATYLWALTNGTITLGQGTPNITFTAGTAGPSTLTVTVTTTPGCSANNSVLVTISSLPVAAITAATAVCELSTGNIASVPDAGVGATYLWAITNGTITAGQGTPSITWTASATGPVTLDVTVGIGVGCSVMGSVQVAINLNPTAAAGPPQTLCELSPGPTVFTVNGTVANGTPLWSVFGSTGTAMASIVTPNSAMTNVNVTGTGTVTLRLTVTSNTVPPCGVATSDVLLTINPFPVVTITAPPTVCELVPGNTASVPDAGAGATYTWTITNGTINAGQGTPSITWTAGAISPVTINVTVVTAAGCTASSSATIALEPCSVDLSIVKTGSEPFAYETGQFTYLLTVVNHGPGPATNVIVDDPLPAGLTLVSATPSQGTCTGTTTINCNLGTLSPQATATVTLIVTLPMKSAGTVISNTATVTSTEQEVTPIDNISTVDVQVEKVPPGPGRNLPPTSQVSDQKSGSVLVFPYYTSDATVPSRTNSRICITNVENQWNACVHLFFVDGATCSVIDTTLCLTPNQTTCFLMSDIDPGTSGYLIAVQVDCTTGCPLNINTLIGDAYVKAATGHEANYGAEAISGLPGVRPLCNSSSTTALLRFDGVMYNQLPRALGLDSLASRADGNDTQLVLSRIGGDMTIAAEALGPLFGLLYDDAENSYSFAFSAGCQFRSSLTDVFPRTTPRLSTVIPAGRSGWMRLYGGLDGGMFGVALNFNPNIDISGSAFGQGHNLHKLTLTPNATLTIPIYPPGC